MDKAKRKQLNQKNKQQFEFAKEPGVVKTQAEVQKELQKNQ